ncbi:hypothetical protein BH09SUM1_BH09SUM1_11680 [soil metagenome]
MKNTRFLFASLLASAVIGGATVSAQMGTAPASTDAATMADAEPTPTPIALQPRMMNSAGELQQMINLPTTATLKESEEDPAKPKSVFDGKDLEKIFGSRFIYYPEGVDPMIIPWVRERIVAEELFTEAQVAETNSDWNKAESLYKQVRELYPTTEAAGKVPDALQALEIKRPGAEPIVDGGIQPPVDGKVGLPEWIKKNTSGVMIQKDPVVIIGNDFLKVGDPVPRFSSVHVKAITPSEVVYEYQGKEFPVQVVGSF